MHLCGILFKMSFDDLAKYGGLYGSEGVLNNIKVSTYVSKSYNKLYCLFVCVCVYVCVCGW